MEVTYQKEWGGTLVSECRGEHHLPDYLGDIKKVLSSSARVVPAGKFVGGGEVQLGGAVVFDVWYLDSESRLSHESFSADYEFSFPCGEEADGTAFVSVLSFSLRPVGPRRISAKATLEAVACLEKKESYTCENKGETSVLHTLPRELAVGYRICSSPMEREYAEQIPVPEAYASAEILHSEGCLHIERAEASENSVKICGNYAVSVILGAEGMPPLRLSETYPVEEILELEGAAEDMCAAASGVFTSFTCNLREEETPMLAFHGILELSAFAEKNACVSVVEDAFLEGGSSCTYETMAYDTLLPSRMLCRTVEQELAVPEGEGSLADGVFHTTALLKNQAFEATRSELQYTAEAEICVLGYSAAEEGEIHYASRRMTVPIKLALPLEMPLTEDARIRVFASVGMCEGRVEEDRLHVSITVCLFIRNWQEREIQCVRCITPTTAEAECFAPTYTMYYRRSEDTLWSISKRYGVSPASVAACNHLSVMTGGSCENLPSSLLIDRRRKTV